MSANERKLRNLQPSQIKDILRQIIMEINILADSLDRFNRTVIREISKRR